MSFDELVKIFLISLEECVYDILGSLYKDFKAFNRHCVGEIIHYTRVLSGSMNVTCLACHMYAHIHIGFYSGDYKDLIHFYL